jgi:hypothetical protein
LITSATGPDVTAVKLPLAGAVAVIASEPTGSVLLVIVATHCAFTVPVLISVPLLKKLTGPGGQTPLIGTSVSVIVTGVPKVAGFGPATSVAPAIA